MIVIVDNYDSFVYNIAEYVSFFDRVRVVSRERVGELYEMDFDGLIISPGPGKPDKKLSFIFNFDVPVLGICLGHQLIAEVFGGKIGKVAPVHGKASLVRHDSDGVFRGVRNPVRVGRYHSLAVLDVPDGFVVSAVSDDGIVMGIRSCDGRIEGLQFHPESVLTQDGLKMIRNFVERCKV